MDQPKVATAVAPSQPGTPAVKKSKEEEEVVFENDFSGIIKTKDTTKNAQIKALRREFGEDIPHNFLRLKYKVVYSPEFPPGLLPEPQRIIDYNGNKKIILRKYDYTHLN